MSSPYALSDQELLDYSREHLYEIQMLQWMVKALPLRVRLSSLIEVIAGDLGSPVQGDPDAAQSPPPPN